MYFKEYIRICFEVKPVVSIVVYFTFYKNFYGSVGT